MRCLFLLAMTARVSQPRGTDEGMDEASDDCRVVLCE